MKLGTKVNNGYERTNMSRQAKVRWIAAVVLVGCFVAVAPTQGAVISELGDWDYVIQSSEGVPAFQYHPGTGEMKVLNDEYLIGMMVPGPVPLSVTLPPGFVQDNGRGQPAYWNSQYFEGELNCWETMFNGQVLSDFVFATYELGLGAADFGKVEWSANPDPLLPGTGGFVDVIIIPEPGTMALLAIGGLGALVRRRRK